MIYKPGKCEDQPSKKNKYQCRTEVFFSLLKIEMEQNEHLSLNS